MSVININGVEEILSIIPASGWWSKWDNEGEIIYNKVVCFGLIKYYEGGETWEMVVGFDSCDTDMDICESMQNFKGYEYRSGSL